MHTVNAKGLQFTRHPRTVILSREDGEGSQVTYLRSFASLRMTADLQRASERQAGIWLN
jgi:hypothetical protein